MPDLRKGTKATRIVRFSILTGWGAMTLVEILESRKQALRVSEVATLFAVTSQHIYKMAAIGMIENAFREAFTILDRRINLLLCLPLSSLEKLAIKREIDRIGQQ
jgi:hypothetical protein